MIPSYPCLAQSSPEPAGLQKLGLDQQRRLTVYSQTSINNMQSNVDNHTRSKQAIIRTIHQTVLKQR